MTDDNTQDAIDDNAFAQEARLWQNETWTAKVIKNDDDDGWAVAMFKDGESEAALIGPWTMGRDKKNPKPLDGNAFITLVKTASEFVRRSEQQLHATLHQSVTVNGQTSRITVLLDIVPDDDNPYATLSAQDEGGDTLAEVRVDAGYKLNRNTAQAWVDGGFAKPKGSRD
jgi:maltose-binding protein MalE